MARYFFNIRDGQHFETDPVGEDLKDLEEARLEAFDRSRDLLSNADLVGDDYAATQIIEITNCEGVVLLKVPIREAAT